MNETAPIIKKVALGAGIGDGVAIIVCLIFGWFSLSVILGLLLGTILEILLFVLLAMAIAQAIQKSPNHATRHIVLHYILRMVLFGVALYLGMTRSYLSWIAMLVPVVSVHITLYIIGIFGKEWKRWKFRSMDRKS